MSELAPTQHTETDAPPPPQTEADIIDFPTPPDESKRIGLDYAREAADLENVHQEIMAEARADVARALFQKSPLLDQYRAKLADAVLSHKINDAKAGEFYDTHYRNRRTPQRPQEDPQSVA
jgi:predicted DNA-binding protein (UPF0251 family)